MDAFFLYMDKREYALGNRLSEVNGSYDVAVIDCSPSLSLLTINALVASNDLIIPVQTHYYALEGLRQLLETVDIVQRRFNQNLEVLGLLLTFVESRTKLSRDQLLKIMYSIKVRRATSGIARP